MSPDRRFVGIESICAAVQDQWRTFPIMQHATTNHIVDIEGVRENQLVGYGLVVGLNGTGDSLNNAPFTKQSLQSMLERLGVNTAGENVRTANVAAVMVTASVGIAASRNCPLRPSRFASTHGKPASQSTAYRCAVGSAPHRGQSW